MTVARPTTLATALCLAAGGCVGDGSVSLRFDVPDDPALQPAGADTLTLIARVGDDAPRETTAEIGDGTSIDLGELPVETDVWLSAEMRTAEGQLVGYGRSAAPLTIEAERDVEATIPVRRPFVYVAGASNRVVSLDTSVSASTSTYQGQVATSSTPTVVADVAGVEVAALTATGELTYLSTATHATSDRLPGLTVAGTPLDAVATPDGAFLVIGHGGGSPQATIVEVGSGATAVATLPAPADRVAVTRGSDGGWWGVALLGRATTDTGCTPSRLATFPLSAPETATIVDTGLGLADVTGDVATSAVYVADRCGDRVLHFDPVTGSLETGTSIMSIAAPTALAADNGVVWAVGHDAQPGSTSQVPDGIVDAWIVLGRAEGGDAQVEALQPVIERFVATDLNYPDQSVVQDLHANDVVADDLVVLPGGQYLGLLTRVDLHGDEVIDGVFGTIIIPELDVTTREYWLLDSATHLFVQRVRPQCSFTVGQCDVDFTCSWACHPDIDAAQAGSFAPTGIAALFGAR